jgi:hypothetical protein
MNKRNSKRLYLFPFGTFSDYRLSPRKESINRTFMNENPGYEWLHLREDALMTAYMTSQA